MCKAKNKLQIYYDINKKRNHICDFELKRARQSFFSDSINKNSSNAHTLFNVIDRLTNPSASVPPELLSTKSCHDFAFIFLTDKIPKIGRTVGNYTSIITHMSPLPP